ncbi:MAG: hypothetical protein ABSC05_19040 [Candidatus Solibacter sp.]|jgi:hypothetical protein
MASVRVFYKKQVRIDRMNFRQQSMLKIGTVGVATVKNRVAAALDSNDAPSKPLTKGYARRKTKLGLGDKRNLMFTGDMLRNFQVRTVSDNKAKANNSTRTGRLKAWLNQKIEPWVLFSPKNQKEVAESAAKVLKEMAPTLVLERTMEGK